MCSLRFCALGLSLVVLLLADAPAGAQDARQPRRPTTGSLLPAGVEEKLQLTAEQKEKVTKIDKEFTDKHKDAETKVRELMEKARKDRDRAAMQKAREQMEDVAKQREAYVTKLLAVLNAEQKKTFEQAKGAATRPGVRPAEGAGQFLSPALQERLNLSAEQKEKLSQIQKDFETKALQVLTEEQKKKYEELKQGRKRPQQQSRLGTGGMEGSASRVIALARVSTRTCAQAALGYAAARRLLEG